MQFIFNELSFRQEFFSEAVFRDAVEFLGVNRARAERHGQVVKYTKSMAHMQVAPTHAIQQAVQSLTPEKRRALQRWISTHGPFWDDERAHTSDDYFVSTLTNEIVTDTGIGEAAQRTRKEQPAAVLSVPQSTWAQHPLGVVYHGEASEQQLEVVNYFRDADFEAALIDVATPITSWAELRLRAAALCPRLHFLPDAYRTLDNFPFGHATAVRLLELFSMLDAYAAGHEGTVRTPAANLIYTNAFTGQRAWFTDSSDSEKNTFRRELTFRLPDGGEQLCGMHGKVNSPSFPIRFHFTWPISAEGTFTVVHVGRKITV